MTTTTCADESLVERDEVLYPATDMIDDEPLYRNFTSIENLLQYQDEQKHQRTRSSDRAADSTNPTYRAVRIPIESGARPDQTLDKHPNPFREADGYVFNLIQIVDDVGFHPSSTFTTYLQNNRNNKRISSLLSIVSGLGGAFGPLTNVWRRRLDEVYFRKWFLEKQRRSAPLIDRYAMNHTNRIATQKAADDRSNTVTRRLVDIEAMSESNDDKSFQDEIHRMYGFEDTETDSSVSSRRSSIDENYSILAERNPPAQQRVQSPVTLNTVSNVKPKQSITIREHYPQQDKSSLLVDRSLSASSSQHTANTEDEHVLSYYNEYLRRHPELNNDPYPEIISEPNPDQITQTQNVTIRYLVPPTPPPPGPLIIRETFASRASTPPSLIVHRQDPSPETPPPLILREAPPPPPPHQEPTIITRMIPPRTMPSQSVILERDASLPPKPQSIIIEKWLPYKPAPPPEVIYEHVTEAPLISQFQPDTQTNHVQYHYSTDFEPQPPARVPIPVTVHHGDSSHQLDRYDQIGSHASLFNQFARSTQQQIEAMQQRTLEQIQAQQQWMANQWQQQAHIPMPNIPPMTTPVLIVNHPPVTMSAYAYAQREAMQQEFVHEPLYFYPSYT